MTSELNSRETESSDEDGLWRNAGPASLSLWMVVLVLVTTVACGGGGPIGTDLQVSDCAGHAGPIVVIALDALPSDLWEAERWQNMAPALTQLAGEEGSWVGTGVASSSAAFPAAVSLWTGLEVRRHGMRGGPARREEAAHRSGKNSQRGPRMRERLSDGVTNLAEVLAGCGYEATVEWSGSGSANFALGLTQGVERVSREGREHRQLLEAIELLEAGQRKLYWMHIDRAQPPWLAPATFLERLGSVPAPAPVRWREIEQLKAATPQRRAGIARAYDLAVAAADHRVGLVLERLKRSPGRDNTILVVVGTAAADIEGETAAGYSNGLSPRELTVPLLLRLPTDLGAAQPSGKRVGGVSGLFAYLAGLVGVEAPPAVVASILPGPLDGRLKGQFEMPLAIESELPIDRGVREVSLLEGDLQLVATWVTAPGEGQLTGRRLNRWSEDLESEPISDPGRIEAMSSRLVKRLRLDSPAARASAGPCRDPAWDWSAKRARVCSSR